MFVTSLLLRSAVQEAIQVAEIPAASAVPPA